MIQIAETKPALTARLLTIVAMLTLLFGKTVHLCQENHDCACHSQAHQANSLVAHKCQHGCRHSKHKTDTNVPDDPKTPHSSHQCTVCHLLLQVAEQPVIMTMQQQAERIEQATLLISQSAKSSIPYQRHLRGPPLARAGNTNTWSRGAHENDVC